MVFLCLMSIGVSASADRSENTAALGYLGASEMALGTNWRLGDSGIPQTNNEPRHNMLVRTVGFRYWLYDKWLGLDAGFGGLFEHNKNDKETLCLPGRSIDTDVHDPRYCPIMLHLGLPLLIWGDAFSVQIIPEINVGYASGNDKAMFGTEEMKIYYSGIRFDVGARLSGELNLGFLRMSKLSLQASIALQLRVESFNTEFQGDYARGHADVSKRTRMSVRTSWNNSPWNILVANVAGLYYFD